MNEGKTQKNKKKKAKKTKINGKKDGRRKWPKEEKENTR